MAWATQIILLSGVFLSLGLSPLRWIDPETLNTHALQTWLSPWVLGGYVLCWMALAQAQPVLRRLPNPRHLTLVVMATLAIPLIGLLPWAVVGVVLLQPAALGALLYRALFTILLGLGPAAAVGLCPNSYAIRIAGLISILATWSLWGSHPPHSPWALFAVPVLVIGWLLVGVAAKATQPQPL